jgi:hypothetical protein
VLIAPQAMTFDTTPDLSSPNDILAILGPEGRIAVAQTNAVPAGIYAREAMESLGIWDALAPRLAQSDNVRGAVFLVARGKRRLALSISPMRLPRRALRPLRPLIRPFTAPSPMPPPRWRRAPIRMPPVLWSFC